MKFQAGAQHPRPARLTVGLQEHIFDFSVFGELIYQDVPEKWCNCCDINFWMWMNVEESGFEWSCLAQGNLALQARDSATSSGRVPTKICSGELSELRSKGVPTVITNRPYMLRPDCGCFALAASFRCLHDHVTCQSLCVSLPHLIISTISVWPECDHLCELYIPDFKLRWY